MAGEPNERATLERVGLYLARGAIAEQRLSGQGDGLGVLEWKRPFSDGTPHVLFEPEDLIAPLAALVPRPRGHVLGRIRRGTPASWRPMHPAPPHRRAPPHAQRQPYRRCSNSRGLDDLGSVY